jgi:hypothetical protein
VHTCSKTCMGKRLIGERNPFWNHQHTTETKARISASRAGRARGNHNAQGYRHTEAAKQRIAETSRRLWNEHRDKMLASLPRGATHRFSKSPELRRYRKQFTPRQRREWASGVCAYCGTTEHLELDHIIPIFDGGTHGRENAQTLCRGCNLWKVEHVDLPRYYAARSADHRG